MAVLAAVIVAAAAGAIAWYLTPQPILKYQATALLSMELKPPVVLTPESWSTNDYPSYRRTQIDLLKSRAILAPAVHRPPVAAFLDARSRDSEQVIRSLMANLKIDFGVTDWPSQVLRVTLQGEDAKETEVLLSSITQTFLERTIADVKERQKSRLDSLKQSYEVSHRELEAKRERLLALAGVAGPVSLEEEQIAALQLADYQKELSRIEVAKLRAQARGKTHTAYKPPAIAPETLESWVDKDRQVNELKKRIDSLNSDLQRIRAIAVQPESLEEYRELAGLLRMAQDALQRRRAEMRPKVEARLQQIARASALESEDDEPDEQTLAREAQVVAQQAAAQTQRLRDLAEKRRRFELGQAEQVQSAKTAVDALDATVRAIKGKIDTLELENHAPPRVHGVGDVAAEPLNENESRNRVRVGTLAALLMGAFTLVGFGWWEFQAQRVRSASDIPGRLALRLIGTLPSVRSSRLSGSNPSNLASDSQAYFEMQDSVDSVTTILGHEMEATDASVLLVTSALEHEGKTTLAADLAASFARSGRKTLLIDSDLVRPSLHQRLGQPLVPGLSEALWKQTGPDAGIRSLDTPNLFLLAAGRADPQVMQALGRDAMEPLLEHYRKEFELIIIDSSPVLPLAHAMRISKHVDAAVMAIMNNHSVIPAVAAAHQRLVSLHVPVLGAVFIGPHVGNATSSYSGKKSWKLMRA